MARVRSAVAEPKLVVVGLGAETGSVHVGTLVARGEVPRRSMSGVEAVLSNGDAVKAGGAALKDVVGYDLIAVLLGSAGRLAVISAVTFRLEPAAGRTATVEAAGDANLAAGTGRRVRSKGFIALRRFAVRGKVREKAGRYWHEYTRMRTAIFLLLGILVIVLIGSFVPQQNTSDPTKVEAFLTSWPNLNVLFADLQLPLTQVFVSPVFYVLLGLLYISLGWCVIRRGTRADHAHPARIQAHPAVLGRVGIVALPQLVLPAARRGHLGQGDGLPGARHGHPGAGASRTRPPATTRSSRGCSSTGTTRRSRCGSTASRRPTRPTARPATT